MSEDVKLTIEEWRVVRHDGQPVPGFGFPDEHHARLTLANREQNGKFGPYRLQKRMITRSEWEEADRV